MLWATIKNTEWRPFLDLLSPSFFRVVPAGLLFSELRRLTALYRSPADFERAVAHRRQTLERDGLPIQIAPGARVQALQTSDAHARGQRVLELYFHQVLDDGLALLDLRSERFSQEAGTLLSWNPSGVIASWDPTFRTAIRALYRGFYRDDTSLFVRGLASLGLTDAEDVIRRQFGAGQQRAVKFSLRDFQQKFHDVFVRCEQIGARIDTGFVPLGLCLATLYEHLEVLGEAFDARSAFEAVDREEESMPRS